MQAKPQQYLLQQEDMQLKDSYLLMFCEHNEGLFMWRKRFCSDSS
jgi:hypothetical protein